MSKNKYMKDRYFLFGSDAVRVYDEEGAQGVLNASEDYGLMYEVYWWKEDSTPENLLHSFSMWEEYIVITKQDYQQLIF